MNSFWSTSFVARSRLHLPIGRSFSIFGLGKKTARTYSISQIVLSGITAPAKPRVDWEEECSDMPGWYLVFWMALQSSPNHDRVDWKDNTQTYEMTLAILSGIPVRAETWKSLGSNFVLHLRLCLCRGKKESARSTGPCVCYNRGFRTVQPRMAQVNQCFRHKTFSMLFCRLMRPRERHLLYARERISRSCSGHMGSFRSNWSRRLPLWWRKDNSSHSSKGLRYPVPST